MSTTADDGAFPAIPELADRAPRSLTVVQCVPSLRGGGVERGTLEVSRALVRRGHRSLVISAGGRLVAQLVEEGGEHLEWPIGEKSLSTLRFVRRLRSLCEERGVDVLHARSRVPAWVCLLAWRKMERETRPRFLTTMHGMHSVSRYSEVMTRGERIIAVSGAVRAHIAENYPRCDLSRVAVIPRGVDDAEFPHGFTPSAEWAAGFEREFPALRGRPIVLLPGRVTRLKGHDDAIRALRAVRESGVDAALLCVGGVDPGKERYMDEMRALAREAGVEREVVFAGHRSDIREFMAVSAVVLACSTQPEAFGRTALEALKLGRPVVGYDHGGVGEVVGSVFPGGLVPPGDCDALARAILGVLRDHAAVGRVERYTLDAMLRSTLAVYESMATERTVRF